MTKVSWIAKSENETSRLGRALGRCVRGGDIIGLRGELGAGKTHLARAIAEGMDADPRFPVCSPTFTLINEHPARVRLFHVDLYRLSDLDEMLEIGLFELFGYEERGACLVEWIERLGAELPPDRLDISLRIVDDEVREISAEYFGSRSKRLIDCWSDDLAEDRREERDQ